MAIRIWIATLQLECKAAVIHFVCWCLFFRWIFRYKLNEMTWFFSWFPPGIVVIDSGTMRWRPAYFIIIHEIDAYVRKIHLRSDAKSPNQLIYFSLVSFFRLRNVRSSEMISKIFIPRSTKSKADFCILTRSSYRILHYIVWLARPQTTYVSKFTQYIMFNQHPQDISDTLLIMRYGSTTTAAI